MEEFLESLFGEEISAEQRVAVFTTPDKRTRFFSDMKALSAYALQRSQTANVYFGVWCDIDIQGESHDKENLPKSSDDGRSIIDEMPFAPSIIVDSGYGLHAYWLLHEPWIFTSDTKRQDAASLAKRWHEKICTIAAKRGWALENLGDLTRVLRLPGTLNHDGRNPVPVQIIESHPDRRYAVDDFESYLPPREEPVSTAAVSVGSLVLQPDAEPPAGKLLEAASESPLFCQTWRRKRTDLADPSQSGYDLSLATIAVLRGWTDQEVAKLIIAVRREHNEKPEKALREDYIRRTIAKAKQAAAFGTNGGDEVDLSQFVCDPQQIDPRTGRPRAIARRVHEVDREALEWLWPGRIPLGKLSLLAGDPGLGKSLVSLDMAARVSRGGAWPDTPLLPQEYRRTCAVGPVGGNGQSSPGGGSGRDAPKQKRGRQSCLPGHGLARVHGRCACRVVGGQGSG